MTRVLEESSEGVKCSLKRETGELRTSKKDLWALLRAQVPCRPCPIGLQLWVFSSSDQHWEGREGGHSDVCQAQGARGEMESHGGVGGDSREGLEYTESDLAVPH